MEDTSSPEPPGDADDIRLTLPAQPSYARVARLAIAGLASRNGFSYDEVEDLRIASGELFGVLVESDAPDERLQFSCGLRADALEVTASRKSGHPIAKLTDLTTMILTAVVDTVDVDAANGTISFTKRIQEAP